jgi:hypothetical protein
MSKRLAYFGFVETALMVVFTLGSVPARASVAYLVSVDTSTLSGDSGFLDFQFQPGSNFQSGSVEVSSFTPAGALGSGSASGNVTGTLPPSITIVNDASPPPFGNDYFIGFTYGSSLSFLVTLGGPVIETPNDSSDGSTFSFGMFASDGATPLLTTDTTDGYAFLINVNPDGSTEVSDFITTSNSVAQAIPEPGLTGLIGTGLCFVLANRRVSRIAKGTAMRSLEKAPDAKDGV